MPQFAGPTAAFSSAITEDTWPVSDISATDYRAIRDAIFRVGVANVSCAVTAQGSPDMTVAVAAGTAFLGGTSGVAVTGGNLTISAADSTWPRIDLVQVNAATGTKSVTTGTAGPAPVAPAPSTFNAGLATVRVPAGATAITSAMIFDKRYFMPNVAAEIYIPVGDETTNITTGTAKVTFRMPYAMTLSAGHAGIKGSLATAQTAGSVLTIDVNEGGTTILSTKLTFDNNEKTTTTAAAAPVISDTALAADAEITVDVDQVGTAGAKGLKIWLMGFRA